MDEYQFPCEPVANTESCIVGKHYRFTILDSKVLRYEWAADGVFEDRASTFAINRKFPKPEFRVVETDSQLHITTPALHLTYDKNRFSPNGLFASFTTKQFKWGVEWRYGVSDSFNLGGTARTVDDVDGRCDMGTGIISKSGYAALDDSNSMLFDNHGFVTTRRSGDRIDGYLFSYGYDYKGALRSFYVISGSQPSVPRWCLGNWWSRYHAYDDKEYLALMDKFKTNDIPLSVAVVDMDWHIVEGDEVPHAGWTGYTWNRKLFPDPVAFQTALHERKLKITLNDHPRDGIYSHEDSYKELAKVLGYDTTHNVPILFDPTSPKFMHAFLNVLHRKLEDEGCDFWWIDWQQGSYSRIPGFDPLWLLNHFQYLDAKQHFGESDALIFSRYAGPGSHRYPVGFSGDTIATWASLEFQPEFTATASNVGYGWWSHDIGGHIRGYRDDECTVRWVQLGVLSPIMRLHSTQNRWMSKEPWLYRKESEVVIRDFLQFRHRLVPYIYATSLSGDTPILPLVQPLYWNFPTEPSAYNFPTEYFFGSALVVAPILQSREKRTNLAKTRAWVPPQRHVDILTGTVYSGAQEIDMYRNLHQVPILAPEGSIVPLDGHLVPANGCANPDSFEVLVVVGRDGQFNIIENTRDDAKSQKSSETSRSITIKYEQAAGRLTVPSAGRAWTFKFLSTNVKSSDIRVMVDGKQAEKAEYGVQIINSVPSTYAKVPVVTKSESVITIELGHNPQLSIVDHSQNISDLLLDFQIEFAVKDKIWEIIKSEQPKTTKIARLLSLDLEDEILGPLAELLLADSRV
jgi:hypothetical protein